MRPCRRSTCGKYGGRKCFLSRSPLCWSGGLRRGGSRADPCQRKEEFKSCPGAESSPQDQVYSVVFLVFSALERRYRMRGSSHAAQVCLGLFSWVWQSGHPPGNEAVTEELSHLLPLDTRVIADTVHGGRNPELRVMLTHRADDLPMRFGELADSGVLRESRPKRFRPRREVADKAIVVKQIRRRDYICWGHINYLHFGKSPPWRRLPTHSS